MLLQIHALPKAQRAPVGNGIEYFDLTLYVCHRKLAAIEISEFVTVWYLAWNAVPGGNIIIVGR